jgi:hypothetical protein
MRARPPPCREECREGPLLPKFDYHLDELDPDVVVLRRQDSSFVAAFSVRGITKQSLVEVAKRDYAALPREHVGPLGLEDGPHRSRSA